MRKVLVTLMVCGAFAMVGCGGGEAPKAPENKTVVDANKALASGAVDAVKALEAQTKAAMAIASGAVDAANIMASGAVDAAKALEAETKAALASAAIPVPAPAGK
jgi:hypothetical protein